MKIIANLINNRDLYKPSDRLITQCLKFINIGNQAVKLIKTTILGVIAKTPALPNKI